MINKLVEEGLAADRNHTSGAIGFMDLFLLGLAICLSIISIVLLRKTLNSKDSKDEETLKSVMPWCIASSIMSLLVYPFCLPALVLGVYALDLAYGKKKLIPHSLIVIFVMLVSVLNVFVVFARR